MIDSALVESVIRTDPSVEDCAVRLRHSEDGLPHIVAYIQTRGSWAPDALGSYLSARIPQSLLPSAWVQIARMPLTADGRLDDDVLRGLPIVDSNVLHRCKELVDARVFPGRSRVVMEDNVLYSRPLHLSNLLPAWKAESPGNCEASAASSEGVPVAIPGTMAFSDGGPLRMPASAASTLIEAFVRTAIEHPRQRVDLCRVEGERSIRDLCHHSQPRQTNPERPPNPWPWPQRLGYPADPYTPRSFCGLLGMYSWRNSSSYCGSASFI